MLFTDTDSLLYETKTERGYEDFSKYKSLFDFSNYPQDSKFFDHVNKKVIGKMKDEFKRKIISEIVGFKSNRYFLIVVDGGKIKKSKEVKKHVVKNMRHEKYIDYLFNKKSKLH